MPKLHETLPDLLWIGCSWSWDMRPDVATVAQERLSGVTIPEGWSLVRLGEVFDHVVDTGHERDLPILAVTMDRGVVPRASLERRSDRQVPLAQHLRVQPGDIAYNTMRMWQGASGLVDQEGFLSPAYTVCRPRVGECGEFWIQCFKSQRMIRSFREHSQGFAKDRYRLYFEHFATVPALHPPPTVQRKIAAILSSVDEVIGKSEGVIERLQVVKKTMMRKLLTRGLPGRHTRFKRSKIGEIPEQWKIAHLGDVGIVQTGIAKGKTPGPDAVDVPYLRVANVQDGHLELAEVKTLAVEPSALARYSLQDGDVLFTEGGDADKLGRGCVWRKEIDPCLHQNHIFAVRCDNARLLPEFLSYFGASPAGKAYFLDAAKQTTNLASINSTQLKALPVPLPPVDEQMAIVHMIRAVDGCIESERDLEWRYRSAKAALMSVLLAGEIRVPPHERAV